MIRGLMFAAVLAMAGDAVSEEFRLPVPGAILGMILLLMFFAVRRGIDNGSANLFDAVSPHFPLLFVPPAVGVVANSGPLLDAWVHVIAAIVCGTAITIAVVGLLSQHLLGMAEKSRVRQHETTG